MKQQRGVALLTVLLVVALITIIAMQMGERLQYSLQRSINISESQQAYWYAMGAEAFAQRALLEQVEQSKGVIHLQQPWAQDAINYPLEQGSIEASVDDYTACFNLNALRGASPTVNQTATNDSANKEVRDAFNRLVKQIPATEETESIPEYNADVIADSLSDWLDADDRPSGYFGVESSEYESKLPAYRSADALMVSHSELRLIHGVEPHWIQQLLPYTCVIPGLSELKININTLDTDTGPVILSALLGGTFDINTANNLLSKRPPEGYDDINDFFSEPEVATLNLTDEKKAWFDITTQYFLLSSKSRYNEAQFSMSSLFHLQDADSIRVIRREFGVPF